MQNKPIKRNINMVSLSHEHHDGLLFCWKIRQGIKLQVSTRRIAMYIAHYWDNFMRLHFEKEEIVLFSLINDDKIKKALQDHKQIRKLIANAIGNEHFENYKILSELSEAVDTHIRYEERELFPHLEVLLSEIQLENIGRQLKELHANQQTDDFGDLFWKNDKPGKG